MKTTRQNIVSGIGWNVYKSNGRYYVDLHRVGYPIHSYTSLESAFESLYYQGYVNSKSPTNYSE